MGLPGQPVRTAMKGVEVLRGLIICAHIHEALWQTLRLRKLEGQVVSDAPLRHVLTAYNLAGQPDGMLPVSL